MATTANIEEGAGCMKLTAPSAITHTRHNDTQLPGTSTAPYVPQKRCYEYSEYYSTRYFHKKL